MEDIITFAEHRFSESREQTLGVPLLWVPERFKGMRSHNGVQPLYPKDREDSEVRLAMASIAGTRQERRILYLKLAAEAEITAAKRRDPKMEAAWVDLAVAWMMMATEIPVENERRRRKLGGGGRLKYRASPG